MSDLDWIDDFIPSVDGIRLKEWRMIHGHPVNLGGADKGSTGGGGASGGGLQPVKTAKLQKEIQAAGGGVSGQNKTEVTDKLHGNIASGSHTRISSGQGIKVTKMMNGTHQITTVHRDRAKAAGSTLEQAREQDRQDFKTVTDHLKARGYEVVHSKQPGREEFDATVTGHHS